MAKNKKTAVKYNSIFIIIGSPTNTQYCDDVIKEVHVLSTGTTTTATVYTRRRLKLITRLLVMLAGRWTEIWPASATKQKWISSKLSRTSLRFYIICVNIIMTHRSVARLGIYFREGFSLLFPSFPSFPSLCYPFLSFPRHRHNSQQLCRRAFFAAGPRSVTHCQLPQSPHTQTLSLKMRFYME